MSDPLKEAMAVLDAYMAGINGGDEAAVNAACNFPHVRLAGGKKLVISAPGNSSKNIYVQSVRVNGKKLSLTGGAACATAVRVTITRVGSARGAKAVRAKLARNGWSAKASLAKGRYRVSVSTTAAASRTKPGARR